MFHDHRSTKQYDDLLKISDVSSEKADMLISARIEAFLKFGQRNLITIKEL